MSNLYADHAELYDAIYHWKDYAKEALRVAEILGGLGISPGSRVVEAACGTGNYLAKLQHVYTVEGFDLNAPMLAVAKARLPRVPLFVADMRAFALDRPADALLCLFSSIGYLLDEAALREAAVAFARAVRPGGALIVEPWVAPEAYEVDRPFMTLHDKPELRIARVNTSAREGDHSVMDMHWLVARKGHPVEHFVESHRLWLCPRETMQAALEDAGFRVRFEPHGFMKDRGLFVGTRS
jgi:SAM-dependent methyltransferase